MNDGYRYTYASDPASASYCHRLRGGGADRRPHPREVVAASGAPRPTGPVRLLTGLRYLGHCFNPVSFYYCFDPTGRRVEAVVAEVENIPWGERHAYVLERGGREGTVLVDELPKNHHVSPLTGTDQTYSFRASEPGERLQIHVESRPREAGAGGGEAAAGGARHYPHPAPALPGAEVAR